MSINSWWYVRKCPISSCDSANRTTFFLRCSRRLDFFPTLTFNFFFTLISRKWNKFICNTEKNYDMDFNQTQCGMRSVRSGDLSNKHASAAFGTTIRESKSKFKWEYYFCVSVKLIRNYYVIWRKTAQNSNNDTSILYEKPHSELSFLSAVWLFYSGENGAVMT